MMENMDRSLYEKRKNLICELVNDKFYVPMKEKELAAFMQVRPEEREELKTILNELLMEGRLQISKRGKYSKGEEGGGLEMCIRDSACADPACPYYLCRV